MNPFRHLTPERVIDLTEDVLGARALGSCRPLTSYINRVFEIPLEDGSSVVAKFFRPGRWSLEALEDEQDFVFDLADADVPVVAPLFDAEGESLFRDPDGTMFCLYPRKRGRPFEDPRDADWAELGRTLARVHLVGDEAVPRDRLEWHPETATLGHLELILRLADGQPEFRREYERRVEELVDDIAPLFDDRDQTRLHGDMHVANLLRRPDEDGLLLIDFDDMVSGPPVQDIWMLLPGTVADCSRELEHLLHGYRQFRHFAFEDLDLVEPLRAMRFVHFTAWCALQHHDGGAHRLSEQFGQSGWWRDELSSLREQLARIRETPGM